MISDAAIAVLAASGLRGLTHRAVDRAAGLPEGSTSYYFRTRLALLQAVVARLSIVDWTDFLGAGLSPAEEGPTNPDQLAEIMARVVEHWLTAGRERMLARYELALESIRRPELRAALVAAGERFRALAEAVLVQAGAEQPGRRARDLAAYIDGFVFDQLAGAGARHLTAADLRAAMRDLVHATLRH